MEFYGAFFYVPWLGGFGEWLLTDDGIPNLDTDGNIKGLSFIKSLKMNIKSFLKNVTMRLLMRCLKLVVQR